jgi:hypothetical protein
MIPMLEQWAVNHERLAPAFVDNELLMEVQAHSVHLSDLARVALSVLSETHTFKGTEEELTTLFNRASESYCATNLAISGHVQKLVKAAIKN